MDPINTGQPRNTAFRRLRRRAGLSYLRVAIVVGTLLQSGAAGALPTGFVDETYAKGLGRPTSFAFSPDGRLVVALENGTARIITGGVLQPAPFATLVVDGENERGLSGLAFHPNFASNHYVYFYYTVPAGAGSAHNRVTRFRVSGDKVVPDSAVTILDLPDLNKATHHMGGAMAFGNDGKLYVAVGDASSGGNAQSLATRFGKMLRINADGSVPTDNPASFPRISGTTSGANRAIWAVGLRNPFTFSFQPHGGKMFINDVGKLSFEEINIGGRGRNFGWPESEGATSISGFTAPLYAYGHDTGSPRGCAITGGAPYDQDQAGFPTAFRGKYFFADYCGNWIYYLDPARPDEAKPFHTGLKAPVGLTVGSDGALYYAQRGTGEIRRIRYTGRSSQAILASTEELEIAEGATVRVAVRLASAPAAPVTLTVDRSLSDHLITAEPRTMTFTPANWDLSQSLVIKSGLDGDSNDESARFSLWSSGIATVRVRVTALDGDHPPGGPRAIISSPRTGDTASGTDAEFFGDGRDNGQVVRAAFYVDDVLRYTDVNREGHYHIGGAHNLWNTTRLSNGIHTLKLTVFDNQGKSGSHVVKVRVAN